MSGSQPSTLYRRLGIALILFGLSLSTASFVVQATLFAGLGLSSFLVGLLLMYVPTERTVSPRLVSASCLSSLVNLNSLLEELGIDSKAVYLPAKEEGHQPRAFLPLIRNPDSSHMFLRRGGYLLSIVRILIKAGFFSLRREASWRRSWSRSLGSTSTMLG